MNTKWRKQVQSVTTYLSSHKNNHHKVQVQNHHKIPFSKIKNFSINRKQTLLLIKFHAFGYYTNTLNCIPKIQLIDISTIPLTALPKFFWLFHNKCNSHTCPQSMQEDNPVRVSWWAYIHFDAHLQHQKTLVAQWWSLYPLVWRTLEFCWWNHDCIFCVSEKQYVQSLQNQLLWNYVVDKPLTHGREFIC